MEISEAIISASMSMSAANAQSQVGTAVLKMVMDNAEATSDLMTSELANLSVGTGIEGASVDILV